MFIFRNKLRDWGKCDLLFSKILGIEVVEVVL